VLRALGTVKRIPALRLLVSALLKSLPSLRDIFAITIFYLTLIGIFGNILWGEAFKKQCVSEATGDTFRVSRSLLSLPLSASFSLSVCLCSATSCGVRSFASSASARPPAISSG
jgi:hypothetical protein